MTIDEIKDILGDKGHYVRMAVQNKSLQEKCFERDEADYDAGDRGYFPDSDRDDELLV